MGPLRRVLPYASPLGRVGMAMWAWNNRQEIAGWAGFVAKAVPKVTSGEGGDVLVEARLRMRLTSDDRVRGADGLSVSVEEGVATLSGLVDPDVHDAVLEVATATAGVVRVRDDLRDHARRRGGFRSR